MQIVEKLIEIDPKDWNLERHEILTFFSTQKLNWQQMLLFFHDYVGFHLFSPVQKMQIVRKTIFGISHLIMHSMHLPWKNKINNLFKYNRRNLREEFAQYS